MKPTLPNNSIPARKLKGFRDYLPIAAKQRGDVLFSLREMAMLHGFEPIDTPALEYAETLLGSSHEETDKEVYQFIDHGERQVALRFDLTVPFARFVCENYAALNFPFKRFQVGEVWRGEKPQKGRYRQFYQADIDIVGVDSMNADVEIVHLLHKMLDHHIPTDFTMHLSHRRILSALIRSVWGEKAAENEAPILIVLDKLAKVSREKIVEMLQPLTETSTDAIENFLQLLTKRDSDGNTDLNNILATANAFANSTDSKDIIFTEIERLQSTQKILVDLAQQVSLRGRIKIDLSVARGLGYYTGIVFESTIDPLPDFGSVCSGGRYNNLAERFGRSDLPGVGGSIGVDRLVAALESLQSVPVKSQKDVFIALADAVSVHYGFSILGQLRKAALQADITLKNGKLGQQFKYADKCGFDFVIVIGESELNTQTVTLKNLKTGIEQKNISLAQSIENVKKLKSGG